MKPQIQNIVFELTGACNQNCRFCYNYWRCGEVPPPEPGMARRTLRKLLGQVSVGTMSFSGGEPLLLPNIRDLALKARFKGSGVNILTNGTLLTEGMLEDFQSIGVSAVQIPLLSAEPSVHEYLTGAKGSWDKAVGATRKVVAALGKGACSVLVITRVNAPQVTRTLELIRDLGVQTVMVNRFNLGGAGIANREELSMDRETLRAAFSEVEGFAAANPGMKFTSGVCTPVCLMDPSPYPHIRFSWCSTGFDRRPVAVSYTGDVRFCNHSPHVIGNIYRRNLMDILSDPAVRERYSAVPDTCRGCSFLERCGGGCRAASEQVYGTFAKADPVIE